MPYIGRGLGPQGAFRILDDISLSSHTSGGFNGSRTTFALTVATASLTVGLPETLIIAVDGVIQEAGSAYTISGSNIVFGSAPQNAATFWGVELGDVGGIAQQAVTQSANDNTTNIATTAYVQTELGDYAPLAAPTFTGNAAAVTQAGTDDSTRIATTAHVKDVKIDDFAAGDDNTDLDSSTSRHGLLRKLDNSTTNFLRGDGAWAAAGADISVRVRDGSSQSISHNSRTAMQWDTEDFDTDTMHDNSTNNTRLTCKTAGTFIIMCHLGFAANGTGVREVFLKHSGDDDIGAASRPADGDRTNYVSITTIYNLAVDEYIEAEVYQSSGGALNVYNGAWHSFSMMKIA